MTDFYTNENRERIKKAMPDVWADAVHRVWTLSPDSPDVDWDNALWSIDKLTTLKPGVHEGDPIRSTWLVTAMCMVEEHADQFPHKLQSEVVFQLIAAFLHTEWAIRVRELRYAHNRLEEWRNTLRKEED
mgnify:CR=1 FL=1|jgi:hypothetical protein|nr:MAG TPA: hypothetical protein [Caudoviricetes sp.]